MVCELYNKIITFTLVHLVNHKNHYQTTPKINLQINSVKDFEWGENENSYILEKILLKFLRIGNLSIFYIFESTECKFLARNLLISKLEGK